MVSIGSLEEVAADNQDLRYLSLAFGLGATSSGLERGCFGSPCSRWFPENSNQTNCYNYYNYLFEHFRLNLHLVRIFKNHFPVHNWT